jgi:hypothetical protein
MVCKEKEAAGADCMADGSTLRVCCTSFVLLCVAVSGQVVPIQLRVGSQAGVVWFHGQAHTYGWHAIKVGWQVTCFLPSSVDASAQLPMV